MRRENDSYQTPPYCVEKLLPYIDFRGEPSFIEPCKGDGNIYYMIAPLCSTSAYYEMAKGRDYLTTRCSPVDIIITNPPFSLWREFLEKSLTEADLVIYMLRLNVMGSGTKTNRGEFWNSNRPTRSFPLEKRPSFIGDGKTDCCDYHWLAWDRSNRIKTKEWLNVLI